MSDIRDDARWGFAQTFGHEASGVWSAPGAVTLLGGVPGCADGPALSVAVSRRAVVALGLRDDDTLRIAHAEAGEVAELPLSALNPEVLGGWAAAPFGVAWALAQAGVDLAAVPGADLFIETDVPQGAGADVAVRAAVALALNDVWRAGLEPERLASAVQHPTDGDSGDMFAAFLGAADAAVHIEPHDPTASVAHPQHRGSIPLGLHRADLALLVIETFTPGTDISAALRAAYDEASRMLGVDHVRDLTADDLGRARVVLVDARFRQVRHAVTEEALVAEAVVRLRREGAAAVGELMDASYASLRDDLRAATPELDLAVETLLANGAVGARATNGGLGGVIVALAPFDAVSRIRVALDGAFSEHGFAQPEVTVAAASHGAVRE